MMDIIGIDTSFIFPPSLLLENHKYTLQYLGWTLICVFRRYSFKNHGNHIDQIDERSIKWVVELWKASMSVDILYFLTRLNFIQSSSCFVNMSVRSNGMVIWGNIHIDTSTSNLAALSFSYSHGQCYFPNQSGTPACWFAWWCHPFIHCFIFMFSFYYHIIPVKNVW